MKHEPSASKICFGLNRQLDESSLSCYLQLVGRAEMADLLASRVTPQEIEEIINLFSRLMKTHLSSTEYHRLFLRRQTKHEPVKE